MELGSYRLQVTCILPIKIRSIWDCEEAVIWDGARMVEYFKVQQLLYVLFSFLKHNIFLDTVLLSEKNMTNSLIRVELTDLPS